MANFIFLQITVTADTLASASGEQALSLWDLTLKGGPVMIPIALCSVIAVYIIIERFLTIRRMTAEPEGFLNTLKEFLRTKNVDSAKAHCRATQAPIARIIEKGLNRYGRPVADIEKSMENAASVEVHAMEKGLTALAICSSAAPMLGFLGTVTGSIRAFYDMNAEYDRTHANIDIGVLSQGMYEALITTVAGLIVGIIAFVCYNILVGMIKNATKKLEFASKEFVEILESQ